MDDFEIYIKLCPLLKYQLNFYNVVSTEPDVFKDGPVFWITILPVPLETIYL